MALLADYGARALVFPTVEILPLEDNRAVDAALQGPVSWDWLVLTSANGAEQLFVRAEALGLDPLQRFATTRLAAVGPQTAARLREGGFTQIFTSAVHHAEALAESLIAQGVSGQRILMLRGDLARPELPTQLRAAGAEVSDVTIYATRAPHNTDFAPVRQALQARSLDVLMFASPSSVRQFAAGFSAAELAVLLAPPVCLASIGPVTSAEMKSCLGRIDCEAPEATLESLVATLAARSVPQEQSA
ncbi:MAG: uroporphyrinogen-III synthase [Candidatus Sericytochromatia bacterium]